MSYKTRAVRANSICLFICQNHPSLFSVFLSEVVVIVVQEAAVRVRSSEEGTRPQGAVAAALTPTDAAGVAPESTGRRTDRRGQTTAAAQGTFGSKNANPGGSQQTAGITAQTP